MTRQRMEELEELKAKALQGDTEAQYKLGDRYYQGIGVERDFTESAQWFKKAANAGHVEAQFYLAWQYSTGSGVKRNLKKSFELYTKAAEQNHGHAQFYLAACYGKGEGVATNYQKAIDWLEKALSNGVAEAAIAIDCYKQLQVDALQEPTIHCEANTTDSGNTVRKENTPQKKTEEKKIATPSATTKATTKGTQDRLSTIYVCSKTHNYRFIGDRLVYEVCLPIYDGEDLEPAEHDIRFHDQYMGWTEYFKYGDFSQLDSLKINGHTPNGFVNFFKVNIPENIKEMVIDYVKEHKETRLYDFNIKELIHANLYPNNRNLLLGDLNPVVRIGNRHLLYNEEKNRLVGYIPELGKEGFRKKDAYYYRSLSTNDIIQSAYYVKKNVAVYKGAQAIHVGYLNQKTQKVYLLFDEADGKRLGIEPQIDYFEKYTPSCYETEVPLEEISELYEIRKPYKDYPFLTPERVYHRKNNIWQPWHEFGTLLNDDEWI